MRENLNAPVSRATVLNVAITLALIFGAFCLIASVVSR